MAIEGQTLVAATVLLPVVSGLASLVIRDKKLRSTLVYLTAVILIGASAMLYSSGSLSFSPGYVFETAVIVLDFGLLLYFLYSGFKNLNFLVIGLTLMQLVPLAYLEFVAHGLEVETILMVDSLSVLFTIIVNVVGSIVLIYSLSYMDEHEDHSGPENTKQPRFFFFMILLLGTMNGLVFSNSMYWLYFFWEVTTLCCYELIRHDGTEEAQQNAVKALWMGLIGGVAMVATMFVGHYVLGSVALSDLLAAAPSEYVLLAFAFIAIAAFTKSAQLPFQGWLLGAMVAPTPVSALLHSSTMVNIGVYAILRIAPAIQGTYLTYGIALVGIFTFMITSILALSQKLSKRILAYSTIGNLGLMIFCAAMNTSLSYSAAIILLVFHSMSKGLLFMCAGIVENRLHTRYIEDWAGLITRLPTTATVMMVGIVSMFLPLFGVLLGKWAAIGITTNGPYILGMVMVTMMVIGSSATTLFWAKWLGSFVISPLLEGSVKKEDLSAGYKLSLYGMLGLDILTSLGSGEIIAVIVAPIVAMNYQKAWDIGVLQLSSKVGSFMILPLWGALAGMFILGSLLYRSKGGEIKPAYMSGENVKGDPIAFRTTADTVVEYQIAGMFFDPDITEARWVPLSTVAGILLNLSLLALVML